jgi:hypothetical protein
MNDARIGRDDLQSFECALPPLQERIPFRVALELELGVDALSLRAPRCVDLHRVIDHELDRLQRIDPRGISAEVLHRIAHRRQVDDRGDSGEVLHQDARRTKRDLTFGRALRIPARQRLDVVGLDGDAVLVSQQVLEQQAQRPGEARDLEPAREGRQPRDLVALAVHGKRSAAVEGVVHALAPRRNPGRG